MKENKCVYGLPYRFMRKKLYKVQAWQGLCYWGYVVRAVTPADAWLEVVLKTDCPVDAKHLVEEIGINEKT